MEKEKPRQLYCQLTAEELAAKHKELTKAITNLNTLEDEKKNRDRRFQ
jgi:hypothetical protein